LQTSKKDTVSMWLVVRWLVRWCHHASHAPVAMLCFFDPLVRLAVEAYLVCRSSVASVRLSGATSIVCDFEDLARLAVQDCQVTVSDEQNSDTQPSGIGPRIAESSVDVNATYFPLVRNSFTIQVKTYITRKGRRHRP